MQDIHRVMLNVMEPDWRKIELEQRGLAVHSAHFLGEGWNSRAYLVNNELVFRFPKHAEQWEEQRRESCFLAFAADYLPLAVPRYLDLTSSSTAAAYGYAVYHYLPGQALDVGVLMQEKRAAAAAAIATFLRALHSLQPSPEVAALLPREDEGLLANEYFARSQQEIVPKLQASERRALTEQFEQYLNTPENFSFAPVVLHADLSAEHLLMEKGAVVAVIDFGDVNWGDPDYDFMYLLVDFGLAFVEEVAQKYGHPGRDRLRNKLRYFGLVDQISTILDGESLALKGQTAQAWQRLKQLLRK